MKNSIIYEWSTETVDSFGDIIDSDFADSLSELTIDKGCQLCLVKNIGNELAGLEDRLWAYVVDGKLPEYFSDANGNETGYKVPVKFHKELSKL